MIGFHVGEAVNHKTQGYGGHPMNLYVHLRPIEKIAGWLHAAGFSIKAQILLDPGEPTPGGVILARRPDSPPTH